MLTDGCVRNSLRLLMPWKFLDSLTPLVVEGWFSASIQGIVLPILFLISAPTNIINMVVFYKQGLKERINFCLFWRSFADLVHMTWTYCAFAETLYLKILEGNINGVLIQFFSKSKLLVLIGFCWVSAITTTIISGERCFCVVNPFLAKNILKTKTMNVILVVVSTLVLVGYYSVIMRWDFICLIDSATNKKVMWEYPSKEYTENKYLVDVIQGTIYGLVIPGFCILVVTSSTIITTISLRRMTYWRKSSTSSAAVMSSRDVALTRTLISVSILFVICYLPAFVFHNAGRVFPEMRLGGQMHNTYNVLLYTALLCTYINPSFTFLIYYKTSSRYRMVLRDLTCSCTRLPQSGKAKTEKCSWHSEKNSLTTTI